MACFPLFYTDKIKLNIFQRDSFSRTIILYGEKKRFTFRASECFFWSSKKCTCPKFYFYKYIFSVFFCDDVYLTSLDSVVCFDYLIIMRLEISNRNNLARISGFTSIVHNYSTLNLPISSRIAISVFTFGL